MNYLLRPRIWPSFSPSCRLYEPEAGRPLVPVPATYRLGTPRTQHPAVARWHAHLRSLATAIHEISGLGKSFAGNGSTDLTSRLVLVYKKTPHWQLIFCRAQPSTHSTGSGQAGSGQVEHGAKREDSDSCRSKLPPGRWLLAIRYIVLSHYHERSRGTYL